MTPSRRAPTAAPARVAARALRALGALSILVGLAVWGYLESDGFAERARRIAEQRLAVLAAAPVRIERVEIDVLPPRIVAHGILVEQLGTGDPPTLEVARLALGLDAWGLMRNRLQVEELTLDRPRLRIDLPRPERASRAQTRAGFDLTIRRLRVNDGALIWDNTEARFGGSAGDVDLRHLPATDAGSGRQTGQLSFAGGRLDLRQRNGPDALLEPFDAQVSYTTLPTALRIDSLRAALGDSTVRGSGTVRGLGSAEIDLRGDLAVADIFRVWGPPVPAEHDGRAQFNGTLEMRAGRPVLSGDLSATDARAAGVRLEAFRAYLLMRRGRIALREVETRLYGGELAGSVEVDTEQQPSEVTVAWSAEGLDGATLTRWAPLQGWRMAGRVDGNGLLSWSRPFRRTARGRMDIQARLDDLPAGPRPATTSNRAAGRGAPGHGADIAAHAAPSLPIPLQADARLRLVDGTLRVERLAARLPDSELDVNGYVDFDGPLALGVRLRSDDLRMLDHLVAQYRRFRDRAPIPRIGLHGGGSGELTVGGTLDAPTLRGDVRGSDLAMPDLRVGELAAAVDSDQGWLVARDLRLRRGSGSANGSARLRIPAAGHGHAADADDYAIDLDLDAYPVDLDLRVGDRERRVATVAGGRLSMSGRFGAAPRANFNIGTDATVVDGVAWPALGARGRRNAGFWQLDEVEVAGGGQGVGSLLYVPEDDLLTLALSTRDLDVALLTRPWDIPMGGTVTGRLRLSGPIRRLDGDADLTWTGAAVHGVDLGDVALSGSSQDGAFTLRATPAAEIPAWSADVVWEGGTARPLRVDARAPAVLAARVARAAGLPAPHTGLDGTVDLEITGASQGDWQGSLTSRDLAYGPATTRLQAERFELALRDGLVTADVEVRSSAGELRLRPRYHLATGALEGSIVGQVDAAALGHLAGAPMSGALELDIALGGSADAPSPEGSIRARQLELDRGWPWRLTADRLTVTLEAGLLSVRSASARLGSSELRIDADVAIGLLLGREAPPATARLQVTELPLAPLFARSAASHRLDAGGRVSGTLELAAAGIDPAGWNGSLQLGALVADLSEYEIQLAAPAHLPLVDGVLRVPDGTRLRGGRTDVAIEGDIRLDTASVDLRADGRVGFEPLNVLSPYWGTGGAAEVAVSIRGQAPDLTYFGTARLYDVVLSPPPLRQPVEDVAATLLFDGRQIRVDDVRGTLGGGQVAGDGEIFLRDSVPQSFRIALDVDDATLRLERDVRVVASARLVHDGTPQRSVLSGTVDLVEGRYRRESLADRAVLEILESPDTDPDPLLSSIRLDLRVRGDEDLFVDNNLADVEVNADFDVRGSAAEPVFLGRSTILSGRLFWNGNVFEVLQGTVELNNPFVTEPVFEILARTEIRSYTIDLNLSGSLQRGVQLDYTSTPALSDLEMFNLLAFGEAPESETLQDPRRYQTALGLQATRYLTDAYFSEVERGAQRLFGVDRFRISPTLSGREADATARLTVGKRISRNLYVTYSRLLSSSEDQLLTVEYQLSPRVRIKGTRDEDGSFGIDFLVQQRLRLR